MVELLQLTIQRLAGGLQKQDKPNDYCVEEEPAAAKQFPKSRLTPETDWWIEEPQNKAFDVSQNPFVNSEANYDGYACEVHVLWISC